MRFWRILFMLLPLSACGVGNSDGPTNVVIVGEPDNLSENGVRLSSAGQHIRAATHEGLVGLDPAGQIVPAIAERWIVTDDGLSYIFRLRESDWPDGEEIAAAEIQSLLRARLVDLEGTSLGLDLAKIADVRAMTGRVIEITLTSPMPEFLRLLAQPELGFVKSGSGVGPMIASSDQETGAVRLSALPPEDRGLSPREDWEELATNLTVNAMPATQAVEEFANGDVDLVLNGALDTFPLAQFGPLSQGNIQVDPAIGIFGFAVRNDDGVLAEPARREALSMAIDREALIERFGIGGWTANSWIVPPELFDGQGPSAARWSDIAFEQRKVLARQRISAWESQSEEDAVLRVALPEGPGSDTLYEMLSDAWQDIGVETIRVGLDDPAELELRDRLARYSSPRWFLNQFNCGLEIGLCSEEADALIVRSLTVRNTTEKGRLLAEAQAAMVAQEIFIPLGAPIRWSLVRGSITAFQPNSWGLHPLFPLSQPTI
ncbi:MAG: ABC transporter substrate-binding protein [Pseudomonadota bacterium]